jgi:hypothetical protein
MRKEFLQGMVRRRKRQKRVLRLMCTKLCSTPLVQNSYMLEYVLVREEYARSSRALTGLKRREVAKDVARNVVSYQVKAEFGNLQNSRTTVPVSRFDSHVQAPSSQDRSIPLSVLLVSHIFLVDIGSVAHGHLLELEGMGTISGPILATQDRTKSSH